MVSVAAGVATYCLYMQWRRSLQRERQNQKTVERPQKRERLGVNKKFLRELRQLLKIMIPGLLSKETLLLVVRALQENTDYNNLCIQLHSGILVSRTFVSIYVAKLEGRIVQTIVQKDMRQFVFELLSWLSIAIPATLINSLIRYFESRMGLAFRTRLSHRAYEQYFKVSE